MNPLRFFALAAAALALAGCAARQHDGPTAECPVCVCNHDEECRVVDVTADTPRAEWDGKTWYFCSEECKEAFLKQPGKFAGR